VTTLTLDPPPTRALPEQVFGPQLPTDSDHHDAVYRGATLLDRVRPGWEYQVDVQQLDISCPFHCVLSEVFGRYGRGLVELFGSAAVIGPDPWNLPTWYGFDNIMEHQELGTGVPLRGFDTLTDMWIIQVTMRKVGL